jgi:hypothetical protein
MVDNAATWLSSEAYRLFSNDTFTFEPLDSNEVTSGAIKAYQRLVRISYLSILARTHSPLIFLLHRFFHLRLVTSLSSLLTSPTCGSANRPSKFSAEHHWTAPKQPPRCMDSHHQESQSLCHWTPGVVKSRPTGPLLILALQAGFMPYPIRRGSPSSSTPGRCCLPYPLSLSVLSVNIIIPLVLGCSSNFQTSRRPLILTPRFLSDKRYIFLLQRNTLSS